MACSILLNGLKRFSPFIRRSDDIHKASNALLLKSDLYTKKNKINFDYPRKENKVEL